MEQNANESCVNVCVIQVQNRAGWLTMSDSLYCNALIQNELCESRASHHNGKQDQILKINMWRRLFNKNEWPRLLTEEHFFFYTSLKGCD